MFILIIVLLSLIQLWSQIVGYGFSVSSLIYWFIFFFLVYLSWAYKWQALSFFLISMPIFLTGVFFTFVQLIFVAETLFRIWFIFFTMGIIKALFEYRKRLL